MTSDDPTEGAVAETASAADAPAPDSADGEGSTKDKWRQALDRYLEGNLSQALTLVDEILKDDPTTDLRPRLERLKRRALDRQVSEEPAPAAAPAPAAPAPAPAPAAAAPAPAPAQAPQKVPSGERPGKAPSGERATRRQTGRVDRDKLEAKLEKRPSSDALPTIGGGESHEAPRPTITPPDLDVVGGESGEGPVVPPAPSDPVLEPVVEGGAVEPPAEASEAPPVPEAAPAPPEPAPAAPTPPAAKRTTPPPGQILKRQVGPARRPGPSSSGVHSTTGTSTTSAAPNGQLTALQGGVEKVGAGVEKVGAGVEQANKVLGRMQADLRSVAEAYQRVSKDAKRKEQAYDQLYEELRQYKDDFLLNAQKPLFRDVILVYDGVMRSLANFEGREGDTLPKDEVLNALKHLRDEVLETLYRRDIEKIEDAAPKLNIDTQKPVRRVDTDDPAQDRDVIQVVRDGFRLRGTLLRPQEVAVKRHVSTDAGGKE